MKFIKRLFISTLTFEEKKKRKKHLLLCAAAGVMLGLSFPPVPLTFLMFFAFIPYFFVIEQKKGLGEINRFTYFTTFFFTLISIYWVGSWVKDADPFLLLSGSVLMFFNPLLFLIPATLYSWSRKVYSQKVSLLLFPFFWVTYEYFYTLTDLRFPWLTLGHGLAYFKPFIQIADIVGSNGLTLIVIYINIFLYLSIKNFAIAKTIRYRYLALALTIFSVTIVYGFIKINNYEATGNNVKIGVVQPDFNPHKKWEMPLDEQLPIYLELTKRVVNEGAVIAIWPETAIKDPILLYRPDYFLLLQQLHQFLDDYNISLLSGMQNYIVFNEFNKPSDAKYSTISKTWFASYNSITGFQPFLKKVEIYEKMLLVPFGERTPFIDLIPILGEWIKWNVGVSSWNVGKEIKNINFQIDNKNIPIGSIVCIESIYQNFVAKFVQQGAQMIAVVTNDSWYGNSSGPYQHKEISVLRAVENRRSVVRSANGGISCFINPLGYTEAETKMFTRTTLTHEVELRTDITFFTKFPLLIPLLASAISLALIIMFIIRKFFIRNKNA